ncbi:metal ABC transporter ATP-binding protein [Romboutsia sp. 1001713B170207_170306_H8]|uniref:metal ABC transporter ATP-binding protein n=1 Tax=Romboutsia sp. 1001713B170207_170306_H8 TaxID=2787112 RepID=UPI0008227516|nr:metal ABC transporter ATP-binding protein [Romboutsia sp. 1001713B170207_170306_H8]SCH03685.1 Zinc import ATP-binding protein ZnuC [uncultured Clostridium sp.]
MVNIINFKNVSFGYEDKTVLENVNFNVNQGDYIGIIGPNGSGKTTLLKLIINEINPTKGKIKILNKDIQNFNNWEKIGYVNQKSNSFTSSFPATVTEVVAMDLAPKIGLFKRIKKKHLEEVYKVLKLVGIYEFKDRLIGSLSGGQQQKVFICRALMRHPKILILDEPTVGIDLNGQKEFYEILKKLNEKLNLTIVIVSHDLFIVKEEVKKIAVIKDKNIKVIDNIDDNVTKNTLLDLFEM